MSLTYSPQLRKAILNRRARPTQQFGQEFDRLTSNGSTGCTDTVLQWLVFLWTGKKVAHDDIRRAAGITTVLPRGLYPYEVERVCKHYGLPYQVRFGMSALEVAHASKKGPVGFGHRYSYWPDWKGYRTGGNVADGKPNGFARPYGKAGHTQRTWDGAHFGALLGYASDPTGPDIYYAWEPNHNSPSRPEKPPYDRMSYDQFKKVYDSYRQHLGRAPYALIPTKTLPAKGF